MSDIMSRLKKTQEPKPPIGIIYGRPGIGKTSVAAEMPSPIFIQTEDGLIGPHLRNAHTFGVLKSFDEWNAAMSAAAGNAQEQGWKTIVIDSLDTLNPLIEEMVCAENGWKNLTQGQYGAGTKELVRAWSKVVDKILKIRDHAGLSIVMIGHHKTIQVNAPDSDPYHKESLTLADQVSKMLIAHCDFVLFATMPTNTISRDLGFNKKATRAIAEQPVFWTKETGAHIAKNRFQMPEKLPLSYEAIAEYVPWWGGKAHDAAEAAE